MADEDLINVFREGLERATGIDINDPSNGNWEGISSGQDTNGGAAAASIQLNGGTALAVPDGASLRVKALSGNAGVAYVGAVGTDNTTGYELTAGDSVSLDVTDVSSVGVYVNAGEGVSWIVEQ